MRSGSVLLTQEPEYGAWFRRGSWSEHLDSEAGTASLPCPSIRPAGIYTGRTGRTGGKTWELLRLASLSQLDSPSACSRKLEKTLPRPAQGPLGRSKTLRRPAQGLLGHSKTPHRLAQGLLGRSKTLHRLAQGSLGRSKTPHWPAEEPLGRSPTWALENTARANI